MSQFICDGCVVDSVLAALAEETGVCEQCHFCQQRTKCLSLGVVTSKIDDIFALCVEDVEDLPEFDVDSDKVRWVHDGEPPSVIVAELLGCEPKVADTIVRRLRERHAFAVHKDGDRDWYDDGVATYVKRFHANPEVAQAWENFCSTLKHESRFLNQAAVGLLDEILKDAIAGNLPGLRTPITTFGGPGTSDRLFRARQANGHAAQLRILSAPASQMGPPPPSQRSAGRMNAAGIGGFYTALDPKTCLAELRSPVGSSAVVAQFEALRPLRLLDLSQFDRISEPNLSPFLPGFFKTIGHIRFLRRFHHEIRKAVLPDAAPIEYVPTQYVAEYLAQSDFELDGIMFSSAQVTDGINVVVFAKSCAVDDSFDKEFEYFEVEARPDAMRDEDDSERRLAVTRAAESQEARNTAIAAKARKERELDGPWYSEAETVRPAPTLRLCKDSVALVKATQIHYAIETTPVVFPAPWFDDEFRALPF